MDQNIYVVPVSYNQPYAAMDFWVGSIGFPGDRLTVIYIGNSSTKSGPEFDDSTWLPEQGGAARSGANSWPLPNRTELGYASFPKTVPYPALQNAINYISVTPPPPSKSLYAGVSKYSGITQELFQSRGTITLTASMLTRSSLGQYRIILPQAMPSNSGMIATSNSGYSLANGLAPSRLMISTDISLRYS